MVRQGREQRNWVTSAFRMRCARRATQSHEGAASTLGGKVLAARLSRFPRVDGASITTSVANGASALPAERGEAGDLDCTLRRMTSYFVSRELELGVGGDSPARRQTGRPCSEAACGAQRAAPYGAVVSRERVKRSKPLFSRVLEVGAHRGVRPASSSRLGLHGGLARFLRRV